MPTSLGLALGAAAAIALAAPASAQSVAEDVIVIPIDTVVFGPAGSVTSIASAPVPEEFQGSDCTANVRLGNQESVHLGNDLIVESGGSSAVVEDVESEPFGTTGATVPLTLGETVDVSLRFGADGIWSPAASVIGIDCPVPAAPPTTEPAPTTTVVESQPPAANPPAAQPPRSLPPTGLDGAAWTAIAAVVLLAGGSGLVVAARRTR
jgi:hypothetical protein